MAAQRDLSLMGLPAKLRFAIYNLVLIRNEDILVAYERTTPPILHVSRRVREEASKIYYGSNTFSSNGTDHIINFLQRLQPKTIALVKRFRWAGIQPILTTATFFCETIEMMLEEEGIVLEQGVLRTPFRDPSGSEHLLWVAKKGSNVEVTDRARPHVVKELRLVRVMDMWTNPGDWTAQSRG